MTCRRADNYWPGQRR